VREEFLYLLLVVNATVEGDQFEHRVLNPVLFGSGLPDGA
jgi:hypothetical protein